MSECLVWERDGHDWPNRESSRFVQAGGLRWHVQQLGRGPVMLLIHGTGAATHSWRDLAPLLAQSFTLVSADLPAHAFTETPPARGLSLPGMAASMASLVDALGLDVFVLKTVAWVNLETAVDRCAPLAQTDPIHGAARGRG